MIHSMQRFNRVDETRSALSSPLVNLYFYDLPKHYQDEYKAYDLPRFCTILQGSKEVRINQSESFVYQKDQFILLPPQANVYLSMPDHTKALVYEFSDEIVNRVKQQVTDRLELSSTIEFDCKSFKLDSLHNRVAALHQRTQDILNTGDLNVGFLIDLTCQELVYELIKIQGCYTILHDCKNHPIKKAIQLMKSDAGLHMNISDIADEVNMSLANFSQKFKIVTEQNPKEYLTRLKLNKSKQILQQMSVTDTSLEVGFENISHFIRLFKNEFGITPKQFQLSEEKKSTKIK